MSNNNVLQNSSLIHQNPVSKTTGQGDMDKWIVCVLVVLPLYLLRSSLVLLQLEHVPVNWRLFTYSELSNLYPITLRHGISTNIDTITDTLPAK